VTDLGIGSFPNSFVESQAATIRDMLPAHGQMYSNQQVGVGFSLETRPDSGLAQFTFYCLYKIIDL
jgi:hypothetical protein